MFILCRTCRQYLGQLA